MPSAVTSDGVVTAAPTDEVARKAYFEAKHNHPQPAAAAVAVTARPGAAGAGHTVVVTPSGMTITAVADAATATDAPVPVLASPLDDLLATASSSASARAPVDGASSSVPFASPQCPCRDRSMVVGDLELVVGKRLTAMTEHTSLFRDPTTTPQQLRDALDAEGYLLLRGVLPADKVLSARQVVLDTMRSEFSGMLDLSGGYKVADARIANAQKGVLLTGFQTITKHAHVLSLLEGDELAALMRALFGEGPATFDNKWVRVHGHGDVTDEHTDFYRFSGSALRMVTCWVPLGAYHPVQGTLAVCVGSHKLAGYTADTYGNQTKVELPPEYSQPGGVRDTAQWKTTHFQPGDCVVFDIRTIHASTANTTHHYRISMDTRWQPGSCVPPDAACMYRHFPDRAPAPAATAATAPATATSNTGATVAASATGSIVTSNPGTTASNA